MAINSCSALKTCEYSMPLPQNYRVTQVYLKQHLGTRAEGTTEQRKVLEHTQAIPVYVFFFLFFFFFASFWASEKYSALK